jgi:hypothetical protein
MKRPCTVSSRSNRRSIYIRTYMTGRTTRPTYASLRVRRASGLTRNRRTAAATGTGYRYGTQPPRRARPLCQECVRRLADRPYSREMERVTAGTFSALSRYECRKTGHVFARVGAHRWIAGFGLRSACLLCWHSPPLPGERDVRQVSTTRLPARCRGARAACRRMTIGANELPRTAPHHHHCPTADSACSARRRRALRNLA